MSLFLLHYTFTYPDDLSLVTSEDGFRHSDIIVLFPSDVALSFPDWMESHYLPSCTSKEDGAEVVHRPVTVIAVDAVWRHARRMASRLRELLPDVKHVQLTPEQMSVYMRKQSQPDRICTVEATALFLQQFGEDESVSESMIECVRINNAALRPRKQKQVIDESNILLSP